MFTFGGTQDKVLTLVTGRPLGREVQPVVLFIISFVCMVYLWDFRLKLMTCVKICSVRAKLGMHIAFLAQPKYENNFSYLK